MKLHSINLFHDTLFSPQHATLTPLNRVVAVGVIDNPLAGDYHSDLSALFEHARELGEVLCTRALAQFERPVTSYGKSAIVGLDGEIEHAHALLHPTLGAVMRRHIGGGEALIPSSAKLAAPGASLDIPLGHKDSPWSFDHFDCITITLPQAPRAGEIALAVAFSDGGRLDPRCGSAPLGR
ncbi:MAG: amino acid synthesis family protein [Pseudomonadales bacterium]